MKPKKPSYLYIAFDLFPSQKGAATHINHCLKALDNTFDTGILICLGNDDMPAVQFDEQRNLFVYRFKQKIVNFLERTSAFEQFVANVLRQPICNEIQLIHFRDIWGGIPALQTPKTIKKVYEVNSFASIELPSRYGSISKNTLQKLEELERFCVAQSDAIITPSAVTARYILDFYNISEAKITTIPNGVTIYPTQTFPTSGSCYILYFGSLQKWQGIKTLFKACKELRDLNCRLVICSSIPEKRALPYQELAVLIGVDHLIDWEYELSKEQLAQKISNAAFTVAPLSACSRNLIQGCNPLKIIESMSYGVPVIASAIPVAQDIITHHKNGILVPPDRPELLGRAIRSLLSNPLLISELGQEAKKLIEDDYLWEYQELKMKNLYTHLLE